MDEFCEDIINYLKKENEMEKILSLIIRDIFLNDLIYIEFNSQWKQYNMKEKIWSTFNINLFIDKLDKINEFLCNDVMHYIHNSDHEKTEKFFLMKEIKHLCNYINNYMDKDVFIENCKKYFHIGL